MLIDCDVCVLQHSEACEECVVTFVLDPPVGAIVFDAAVEREWSPRVAGHRLELISYVRVLNALDRRDAIFHLREAPGQPTRPVSALPVLPVLGLEWRF
jgi:hypothetical protein